MTAAHNGGGEMPISYGSVCSGIEAASVAWHHLGWIPRWFAEIEPFPNTVLAHHWPEVPNLGDFTLIRDKIAAGAVNAPDVLVGGTPCQAFSVAGLRQSLDDKRGQLTLEFVRLADAIDSARSFRGQRPVTVVWENVPGVLTTPDNAFGCFLAGLVGEDDPLEPPGGRWTNAGYVRGPRRAVAWRILDAQYFGVAQRRRRVFLVASAGGISPESVLFEFDGVRRDSPPRREAGQGASHDVARRTGERSHWDGGPHPSLNQSNNIGGVGMSNQEIFSQRGAYLAPHPVAPCLQAFAIQERAAHPNLNAGPGGKGYQEGVAYTLEARHHVQACAVTGDVFHTLRAEGFDASEDGMGRGAGAVAVAFTSKDYGADASEGLAPTMRSMGHNKSHANGGGQLAVAFGVSESPDLGHCLRSGASKADKHESTTYVQTGMQVRRLTPTEAERLQGFPDSRKITTIHVCKNEEEKREFVLCAELDSPAQSHAQNRLVAVHVLINYEQKVLQIRSLGKLRLSVNIADESVLFLHHIPVADFVRLAALTVTTRGQTTQAGKAGQQQSIKNSLGPRSGSVFVPLCGAEIEEFASDVERFTQETSRCMKSIISEVGQNSQSCEKALTTLCCFVAAAISSFIPEKILAQSSYDISIETVMGHTMIPWRGKPADECPDGPRYKALGNSMAVPVMRWIGTRIARQLEAQA